MGSNLRINLKRWHFAVVLIIILVISIFSCIKQYSQKLDRGEMLSGFNHKTHEKHFDKEKVYCSNCHGMQFSLASETPKKAKSLSKDLMYPGMEECHFCHQNEKYAQIASQKCNLCHKDMSSIMPNDHKVDWISRHKMISKIENAQCAKCHRDDYCSDCHLRRDTVRQRVHDRNFMFSHSIEARANPKKCSTCHTAAYCKECHTERGITQ